MGDHFFDFQLWRRLGFGFADVGNGIAVNGHENRNDDGGLVGIVECLDALHRANRNTPKFHRRTHLETGYRSLENRDDHDALVEKLPGSEQYNGG